MKFQSGLPRREVNYTMSDMEFDDPDEDDGKHSHENAATKEPFSNVTDAGFSGNVPSKIKGMEHTDPELSGECIGMGGSFSLDKAKPDKATDQRSNFQTAECLSKTQLSEEYEYLSMGGGFCLNEDDGKDGNMHSTRGTLCDSDPPYWSDLGEDENGATPTRTMNSRKEVERIGEEKVSRANQNSHHNDSDGNRFEKNTNEESLSSLRAMPNLKRKRKKN